MYSHSKDIKIFSANSNKPLAESICQRLGLPMGDSEVKHLCGRRGFRFHQRNRPWLRCIRDPVHL